MEKKPIIKLRVYRGREVNYDAKGNVKNENHLVSLEHGSRNWVLFMKNLHLNGYCKVEVEKAFAKTKDGYDEIEDLSSFDIEVQNSFSPEKENKLTKEQIEIAELKKQMAELTGKKPKKDKKEKDLAKKGDAHWGTELEVVERPLRDIYIEEVGKKPFGGWDDEKISEKLEEHRSAKV